MLDNLGKTLGKYTHTHTHTHTHIYIQSAISIKFTCNSYLFSSFDE